MQSEKFGGGSRCSRGVRAEAGSDPEAAVYKKRTACPHEVAGVQRRIKNQQKRRESLGRKHEDASASEIECAGSGGTAPKSEKLILNLSERRRYKE